MTYRYGKLDDNNQLIYAPRVIRNADGSYTANPTAEEYAAQGYLPVNPEQPTSPGDGYQWEDRGWEVVDGTIRHIWERVKKPPVVHTYSCLALEGALAERGLFEVFLDFLDNAGNLPDGRPIRRAYDRANNLSDAYPGFATYFSQVCTALGIPETDGREILAEAETFE